MSNSTLQETYSNKLREYVDQEKAAVRLLSAVGNLQFGKSIELVLFRNHLVDTNITEIIRLHKYAAEVVGKPINIFDSAELAEEILEMDLAPSKIDIGKLAAEWLEENDEFEGKNEFLRSKLSGIRVAQDSSLEPRDVVLYGFGRIGCKIM